MPATTQVAAPAAKFTFEEEQSTGKVVITIYGRKGVGKTSAALGLSGKKYIISFDGKSQRIRETLYKNDPDIVVLDGRKHYLDNTKEQQLKTGVDSIAYVEFLIDEIAAKGDASWIIVDYVPTLAKYAEMKMRKENGLMPGQGTPNRMVWNDRNVTMARLHRKCLAAVKQQAPGKRCGVVYVTYVKQDEQSQKIVDGETLFSMKKPNYTDTIEQETDIVLHADIDDSERGKPSKNILEIESNKTREFGTAEGFATAVNGTIIDLSGGKRLRDLYKDL